MQKIALLGATGSIGTSTLKVLRLNSERFELYSAAASRSVEGMAAIASEFHPKVMAMHDPAAARELESRLKELGIRTEVLAGDEGVAQCAAAPEVDIAVCAVVGAAGLRPALAAVRAGHTIALANKEALVMSGRLFFDEARAHQVRVLPVDSEHSAIFQSLPVECQENLGSCDLKAAGVDKILLTGSGGPFRTVPVEQLEHVTPAQAVAHPVWNMGPKISVDSATMMNKGLEFIEARYLFNATDAQVQVVIHPQSVVHSMVSYIDGAVMAQLGNPDMCTPIARALGYPGRIVSGVKPLDFPAAPDLTFMEPDFKRYPCLKLAMQASLEGQGATTALNAANEVAVAAFLEGRIGYPDIARTVAAVLDRLDTGKVYALEQILDADARARALATEVIGAR